MIVWVGGGSPRGVGLGAGSSSLLMAAGVGVGRSAGWCMIASFGNSTLASRVKFPKLLIMACGGPTCWTGRGLAGGGDIPAPSRQTAIEPRPQDQTLVTSQQNAITPTSHTVTGDYQSRPTSKSPYPGLGFPQVPTRSSPSEPEWVVTTARPNAGRPHKP